MPKKTNSKELIKDDIEIGEAARTKTFNKILAPLRKAVGRIDVKELDRLVDKARHRHHSRSGF